LTTELVEQAAVVYCMTSSHRDTVIERNPKAAFKVRCLRAEADIDDPGTADAAVARCAQEIQMAVCTRLDEVALRAGA